MKELIEMEIQENEYFTEFKKLCVRVCVCV